jgi:hypothetical protein
MTFLERNDIDQRSEYDIRSTFLWLDWFFSRAFGQFTNITMNETTVLCLTVQNAKYPITLVCFKFLFRIQIKTFFRFRMLFERFVRLPDNYYVFVFYVNVIFKFL